MDLVLLLKLGHSKKKVDLKQKFMVCQEVVYIFLILIIIDDDEETFEKALDAGMDSIIKKPI